jgi:signal-transduction protein with cAMP-binding, CBS, and nucleotidyltransferase domain
MRLHDLLHDKGFCVRTIRPTATLEEVIDELVRHNIGSLIVSDSVARDEDLHVLGIITERDVLRTLAALRQPLHALTVATAMTTDLVTAQAADGLDEAMRLMTHHRVRHLPVFEEDRLLGIISIGDIVKVHHDELAVVNHYMLSYIHGEGAEVSTLPPRVVIDGGDV